ncbi:MAG: hypothetical protein KDE22_00205, partial [Rhodobacterales bacterium]|nr:hypothetical protein [Rhodobacterales bacterium]
MGSPPSRFLWPAWAFLPAVYLAAGLVLRHDGGPFWIWHLVDPSYYYLFDSLNLALGQAPGHPYHPGTPVQMIGALLLHMVHRGVGGDMLVERVLADPEGTLRVLSTGLLCVTAAAMFAAGLLAHRWLGDWAAGLMVQAGPFLSKVVLKNAYHVKPEPLLTALMLVLVVVVIWALRPGVAERHKTALAVLFGLIAGLGVATKLTAAPIFVLPLFLLWGWRPLVLYGLVSAGALALFTLPAWPAFHKFWALFVEASLASGAYGQGARTLIDVDTYPQAVLKIFSRPVLHGVFLACLGTALAAAWRARRRGAPWPA